MLISTKRRNVALAPSDIYTVLLLPNTDRNWLSDKKLVAHLKWFRRSEAASHFIVLLKCKPDFCVYFSYYDFTCRLQHLRWETTLAFWWSMQKVIVSVDCGASHARYTHLEIIEIGNLALTWCGVCYRQNWWPISCRITTDFIHLWKCSAAVALRVSAERIRETRDCNRNIHSDKICEPVSGCFGLLSSVFIKRQTESDMLNCSFGVCVCATVFVLSFNT